MPIILFLWYILTLPADKITCAVWVSRQPTAADIAQACGQIDLTQWRARAVDVYNGSGMCTFDAKDITAIPCLIDLRRARIEVYKPDYQTLVCAVEVEHAGEPAFDEVRAQCPEAPAQYIAQFQRSYTKTVNAPDQCTLPPVEQPRTAADLATAQDYYLLSARLIWHGYTKADCGGFSGLDASGQTVSACGLETTRPGMIAWQNQLDDSILAAAREYGVPAQVLKSLIALETQFWPWTGPDGEHGLIQITHDGADTVLRWWQAGYDRLTPAERFNARAAWLSALDCQVCLPQQAIEHARAMMPEYARALAAYYCTFGSWERALEQWNVKYTGGL